MGKTLVTGVTGLVAFNIVDALRRRQSEIRALARLPDRAREILGGDVEFARRPHGRDLNWSQRCAGS